jgi:hypothetical protein
VAWPCEVGGVGIAMPVVAGSGGNWPRRAHAREEGRRGGHGGELYLAYDRAISENGGADTSSAPSSMADICPRAVHVPRARGSEREGVGLAKREREQQGGAEGMDARWFGGNIYHIHLNYLDLHACGREISPEYPYSNRPINKGLQNARLLPSDSNLWHSLFLAATPTNNRATSTNKNLLQLQPRVSSLCPHLPQNNGN